jgi:hypothetical protein
MAIRAGSSGARAQALTGVALKESVEWFVENYDKGARIGKHAGTNGV